MRKSFEGFIKWKIIIITITDFYILSPLIKNYGSVAAHEFLFILKLNLMKWLVLENYIKLNLNSLKLIIFNPKKKLNCSCFFLGKGKLFLASALREKNDTHFVDLKKRQPFLLSMINDAKHLHFAILKNICTKMLTFATCQDIKPSEFRGRCEHFPSFLIEK